MSRLLCFCYILIATSWVAQAEDRACLKCQEVPAQIQAVFQKPLYKNAVWGLQVLDLDTQERLIDLEPQRKFFIGSVRKIFSVGELLNEVGPAHRYNTPVYCRGSIDNKGVLHGDLILVASGDLTMNGRTNPDGSIAISEYDHNEANSPVLGNAVLTRPDPLAGYAELASQIARLGVKEITGEVIIDDRLFHPFEFREEFKVKPIFVNDDVVDLQMQPTAVGALASVAPRPVSAALGIENRLVTSGPGSDLTLHLVPELPSCIGAPACYTAVTGQIPSDFVPPLTGQYPLVRTVRIVEPSNYARTVLIEELSKVGIRVDAPIIEENPSKLLPPKDSYSPWLRAAELKGLPYSDDAKLVLKISYNIGADTSLVLFGLTQGVDSLNDALKVERRHLLTRYGIPESEFHFVDGSGAGETIATNRAVTHFLVEMAQSAAFPSFFDALPILGVDGSLGFVNQFESDPDRTLAGAKGQVRAKTGTSVTLSGSGLVLKGQALGGYITSRSGRRLVYQLVVNNVAIAGPEDVLQVFQDEGRISALLWYDN